MDSEHWNLVAETRELIEHTRQEISQLREELRSAWNTVGQSQRLLSHVERRRSLLHSSSNSKRRSSERGTHRHPCLSALETIDPMSATSTSAVGYWEYRRARRASLEARMR